MIIANFTTGPRDGSVVTRTVMKTYMRMIAFAMGKTVDGKKMANPSGRFASAITYNVKNNPNGSWSIVFKVDENIAPEAKTVLNGRNYPVDITNSMLARGTKTIKRGPNKGQKYRVIPIKVPTASTASGALLNDPVFDFTKSISRSEKSKGWDSMISFVANAYSGNNSPNQNLTEKFPDTVFKNFRETKGFKQILLENPHMNIVPGGKGELATGPGKFGVRFRTIRSGGPRWILPAQAPNSPIQNLINRLQGKLKPI